MSFQKCETSFQTVNIPAKQLNVQTVNLLFQSVNMPQHLLFLRKFTLLV